MLQTTLAFRVFGSFKWPPLKDAKIRTETRPGFVEVFYRQNQDSGLHEAIMRWTAKNDGCFADQIKGIQPLDESNNIDSLPGLNDEKLKSLIDYQPTSFTLCLSDRGIANPTFGERLKFLGASIIDQYNPEVEAPDKPLHRWPVVRESQATLATHSGIHFGQGDPSDNNANWRLDLVLSIPFRASGSLKEDGVTRVSVIYLPHANQEYARGQVFALSVPGHKYDWQTSMKSIPKESRILGTFAFTFEWPEHLKNLDNNFASVLVNQFWTDGVSDIDRLLTQTGVQVQSATNAKVDLELRGPNQHSLRLRFAERKSHKGKRYEEFTLIRRATYKLNNSATLVGISDKALPFVIQDGQHISLELEIQTKITDVALIANINNPALDVDVRLRLIWDEELPNDLASGKTRTWDAVGYTDLKTLFAQAIHTMHQGRISLQTLQNVQPVSFLPELGIQKRLVTAGLFLNGSGKRGENGVVKWMPETRKGWHLSVAQPDDTLPENGGIKEPVFRFILPGFQTAEADPILLDEHETYVHPHHIVFQHDPAASSRMPVEEFAMFKLVEGDQENASNISGRIGDLLFKWFKPIESQNEEKNNKKNPNKFLAGESEDNKVYSYLRLSKRAPLKDSYNRGVNEDGSWPTSLTFGGVSVYLRLRLNMATVRPVTTGIRLGDRSGRETPLLIPLNETAGSQEGRFILDVEERFGDLHDWRMTASLFERSEDEGSSSYLLLGRSPWSVMQCDVDNFGAYGDDQSSSVAAYDSDTRQWQFKAIRKVYVYSLPPMVTGESADKPGRLEVHDREYTDNCAAPNKDDGIQRFAVESRFGPSTRLWINPNDRDDNFILPPWSAHELFRGLQRDGIGVGFAGLLGEFHYGLSIGVDPTREKPARVSEIETILGRLPGSIGVSSNDQTYLAKRWKALKEAYQSRAERLEIVRNVPANGVAYPYARFSDGIYFSLRNTALHRHPVKDDKCNKSVPVPSSGPRFHNRGLSGGALWPIESSNLARILVERPQSDGGTIESIALSPHGGDADQKALFNGGQIAIVSETRSGFIQRQKVEVLGRIAVFWHRAKHVVVYERTVNPTAQFAPETGGDTRTRRPVLRKVSEYIEILEPERSYPDFEGAETRWTGPLKTVRFNSKIIPVDSMWSEELGDWGWRVPLWNRAAARKRPQVYRQPDIAFVTASEGDSDKAVVAQECRNPHNIFFVSDFETGGADTDIWKSRLGVDASALPLPGNNVFAEFDKAQADDDGRRPSVSRVPPGHVQFTWLLKPGGKRTQINAARSDKPVYSELQSITFMRSNNDVGTDKDILEKIKNLASVRPTVQGAQADLRWLPLGKAPDRLEKVGTALEDLRASLTDPAAKPDDIKAKGIDLKNAIMETGKGTFEAKIDKLKKELDGKFNLPDGFKIDGKACETLKANATSALVNQKLLLLDNIRTVQAELEAFVGSAPDEIRKDEIKLKLDNLITDIIQPFREKAADSVAKVREGLENATAISTDAVEDVRATLTRVRKRLDEAEARYDRDKPWSQNRLDCFEDTIDKELYCIAGDISQAFAEARQRLSSEVNGITRKAGDQICQLVEDGADKIAVCALEVSTKAATFGAKARLASKKTMELLQSEHWSEIEQKVCDLDDSVSEEQKAEIRVALKAAKKVVDDSGEALETYADSSALGAALAARLAENAEQTPDRFETQFIDAYEMLTTAINSLGEEQAKHFEAGLTGLKTDATKVKAAISIQLQKLTAKGESADAIVDELRKRLDAIIVLVDGLAVEVQKNVKKVMAGIGDDVEMLEKAFEPDVLFEKVIRKKVIEPAKGTLIKVIEQLPEIIDLTKDKTKVLIAIADFTHGIETNFEKIGVYADEALSEVSGLCDALGAGLGAIKKEFDNAIEDLKRELNDKITSILPKNWDDLNDIKDLSNAFNGIDKVVRGLTNDIGKTAELAASYSDRALDALGDLDKGGLGALPNRMLQLHSAVMDAPEIGEIRAGIDRMRAHFDALSNVIENTPVGAFFDDLGDELKSLGLSFPFDRIGDSLIPADLGKLDIGKLFPNFGGINLRDMFPSTKVPSGASDAVKLSHDFDRKAKIAWVQADVNLSLSGRYTLFTVGPFKLDFVDTLLNGVVRLEASADTEQVQETGRATIETTIEAIVAGQKMVALEKVQINHNREGGLDVKLNPKNIKLNGVMQFIQDTLGSIVSDGEGGLTVIKKDGLPVGIESNFSMPPISLMYGTTGIQNISIANRFRLVAYPDFVLANRFNLSDEKLPFIFSFFVLGGTGYVQIDAEYQPFDKQLLVLVKAAIGGSASIGFAFGPVSGSVVISIRMVLSYRKLIGNSSGGGLSVGLELLVFGRVDVCGIVTAYIGLLLNMAYHDNGAIDGKGKLVLKIRVSRFFKIKVRANVTYKLRGGQSQTVKQVNVQSGKTVGQKIDKLEKAMATL